MMLSNHLLQAMIDNMPAGIYELREIVGIPPYAACPGPTGVCFRRDVIANSYKNITLLPGRGPNGSNIYLIVPPLLADEQVPV